MKKILHELISLLRLKGRPNLTVAILCIVAGMIFWFFNALNKNYSTNINYPLTFIYDTEKYQPVDELPNGVLLNMSGVGWNLLRKTFRLKVEPLQFVLETPELTKWIAGASLPSVITDQISDLQLNYVLTDTLYLHLDRRVTQTYTLNVQEDSINLESGYVLSGPIELSDKTVELTGPYKILTQLGDTIFVELPDTGIDEDYDDEIEINFDREDLISRNPPTVSVSFNVEQIVDMTLNVPITLINFPESTILSDSTYQVNVSIRGSSQIDIEEFSVIADYSEVQDSMVFIRLNSFPDELINIRSDSTWSKIMIRE